jgi:hypothetical protein
MPRCHLINNQWVENANSTKLFVFDTRGVRDRPDHPEKFEAVRQLFPRSTYLIGTKPASMRYHALLLLISTLSFAACRKAANLETAAMSGRSGPGSFTALIDGRPWTADSARFASLINGSITLSGTSRDDQAISITLKGIGTGHYSLGRGSANLVVFTDSLLSPGQFYSTGQVSGLLPSVGQVEVSAIDPTDTTISGTFSFMVYNDSAQSGFSITQGVFNKLPYFTSLPLARSTDTFSVEINGALWTARSISGGMQLGYFVMQGSEPDESSSVTIHFPPAPGPFMLFFDPVMAWAECYNNGKWYSTLYETPHAPDGAEIHSYPGDLNVVGIGTTSRRMRAYFDFQAFTSDSSSSVHCHNGYFSVQY